MAQLDLVTYLPQVVWLIIIFTLFYLIVQKDIIPMVSTNLKLRLKKLSQGQGLHQELATSKASRGVTYAKIWQKVLMQAGERGQSLGQRMWIWGDRGMEDLVKVNGQQGLGQKEVMSLLKKPTKIAEKKVKAAAKVATKATKNASKAQPEKAAKAKSVVSGATAAKPKTKGKKGQSKSFSVLAGQKVRGAAASKKATLSYLIAAGKIIALKGALGAMLAKRRIGKIRKGKK